MLLRRLISLAAALVLACAGTQAHAYARALQPESALPARAMVAPSPHQEIVQVTPSRITEICPPLRECASTLGVTGYRKDEDTGLYYAQARWYDPLVGNFNGMDPWVGDPSQPITLNKQLYANGNPARYVDRTGRCSGNPNAEMALSASECLEMDAANLGVDIYTPEGAQAVADHRHRVSKIQATALVAAVAAPVAGNALLAELAMIGRTTLTAYRAVGPVQAFAHGSTAAAPLTEVVLGGTAAVVSGSQLPLTPFSPMAASVPRVQVSSRALDAELDAMQPLLRAIDDVPPPSVIFRFAEGEDGVQMLVPVLKRSEQARDRMGKFLPLGGGELKPGGPFENRVGDVLRQSHTDVVPQIRIQAEDGTVTVLDYGSRGPNGRVKLTEAKGSETAPLSGNQKIAIPQIQATGGVVVGRGTEQFPSGTQIPPTPVRVVRPSTMERLERLQRLREESTQ